MKLWQSLKDELLPRIERLKHGIETRCVDMTPDLDLAFRTKACETVEKVGGYFDPEVRGLSRLPAKGPYLLVGNHSGGAYTPDAYLFVAAFLRHWGMDAKIRPLAHNILFSIPAVARQLRRLGAMPASQKNAHEALGRGEIVLVYPGGDYESQRPFYESHLIDFNGRKGFIRMALERGVPVIPFVCHGSNETVITLTRGESLARATMLTHITRSKVLPLRLGMLGVMPVGVPYMPLPSKITIEVGHPMAWEGFTAEDAKNDALIDALYDDITGTMQRTLHGLYIERPNPYARRTERTLAPRHSPAPKAPEKALALRKRPAIEPINLEQARVLIKSVRPAAAARITAA
jgi:1-acyl-sn-glycerol-3-phosphate acyltransferase